MTNSVTGLLMQRKQCQPQMIQLCMSQIEMGAWLQESPAPTEALQLLPKVQLGRQAPLEVKQRREMKHQVRLCLACLKR